MGRQHHVDVNADDDDQSSVFIESPRVNNDADSNEIPAELRSEGRSPSLPKRQRSNSVGHTNDRKSELDDHQTNEEKDLDDKSSVKRADT